MQGLAAAAPTQPSLLPAWSSEGCGVQRGACLVCCVVFAVYSVSFVVLFSKGQTKAAEQSRAEERERRGRERARARGQKASHRLHFLGYRYELLASLFVCL